MTSIFSSIKVPAFLAVSGGVIHDVLALPPDEQTSMARMTPARQAEFSHGRWHARRALAHWGLGEVSLPVAADRAPAWPVGFVGSISHAPPNQGLHQPGQVIAVVARVTNLGSIGVDLERLGGLLPEHWPIFLSPRELAWLLEQPVAQRDALAHGIWSAKEATMKALRRVLDPQAIEIRVSANAQFFVAHYETPRTLTGAGPARVGGCLRFEPGWVLALATLPPRETRT